MGNVPSMTGAQKVASLIESHFSLRERYTRERVRQLVKSAGHLSPFVPAALMEELHNVQKMHILPELIIGHLAAREDEFLGLPVVDLVIKFVVSASNKFPKPLADWLENQLWKLDVATMTEEQGLEYLATKLVEFGGDEEYIAKMVDCEACHRRELLINNKKARENRHESIDVITMEIIMEIIGNRSAPPDVHDLMSRIFGGGRGSSHNN